MKVSPPFSGYHFIDLDNKRVARLQEISSERTDVTVHHGDCNQILLEDVFQECRYEDFSRALCLLDPYGINVDWTVLQTAGQMKSIEIFFNFMIMDANMNVFRKNPDNVRQSQIDRMNAAWSDDSWRSAAYRTQPGLFGDIKEKTTNEQVIAAFRKRLKDVAGFKYVPEPIPMRNTSGAVVYYLFFASPNQTGGKIVTEIFDKYRSR